MGRTTQSLVDKKFGKLKVIEKVKSDERYHARYLCECDCGNKTIVYAGSLKSNQTKSCGCIKNTKTSERSTKDITNQQFNWIIPITPTIKRSKTGCVIWKCLCIYNNCNTIFYTSTVQITRGIVKSCGCLRSVRVKGKDHPLYNHSLSDEDRKSSRNRNHQLETRIWRESVYKRDNYSCVRCSDNRGGNLNAHHLNGWTPFPDQRFNVDNGVTLCDKCHKEFHAIYKYGNNTKEQFKEFISRSFLKKKLTE